MSTNTWRLSILPLTESARKRYVVIHRTDLLFQFCFRIICKPAVLSDIQSIPKNLPELDFEISTSRMEIRNHICHPDTDVQTVRLRYQLAAVEFITYEIKQDVILIFTHKVFASILEFAETSHNEIKMEFTRNSEPLIISFDNDEFVKVQMVMSTTEENNLESFKKSSGAKSYRDLIGSYIENRTTSTSAVEPVNLSDSEMQKNLSPAINSFVLSSRGKQTTNNDNRTKMNGQQTTVRNKRKSTETVVENVNIENSVHANLDQAKRHKTGDELANCMTTSMMLAEVAAMDAQSASDSLPQENSITVQKPTTVIGTESDQLPGTGNHRFSIVNRFTEDEKSQTPRHTMSVPPKKAEPSKMRSENAEHKRIEPELLLRFDMVIHPRSIDIGTMISPNSDMSSDSGGSSD